MGKDDVVIHYSLTKSVVRISGQITETHDKVTDERRKLPEAVAELLSVADHEPDGQRDLRIPQDAHANTSSTIVLRDDRRLESIEASFEGRGPARLKAAGTVTSMLLGAALALVNPPAGLSLIAAGATLSGARPRMLNFMRGPETDAVCDELENDPYFKAYQNDHTAAAALLIQYSRALASLVVQHAEAAATASTEDYELLTKKLGFVRTEVELHERRFVEWRLEQVESTVSPIEVRDFNMEDLPDQATILATFNTRHEADEDKRLLRDSSQDWVKVARRFGVAVSVDNLAPQRDEQPPVGSGEIEVHFRPGTDVTLRVWRVRHVDFAGGDRVVAEEPTPTSHYVAELAETRTARVVKRREASVSFAMDVRAWKNGKMKLTFNDLGEPKDIGGDASSLVAAAAADFGDTLKSGIESGSALASALIPGSATAAYLERRVQMAKHESELAAPSDDAKELAALEKSVEIAELEARLRLARLAALRSSGTVVYNLGG